LKAGAYAYADGDSPTPPREIIMLGYIDRFGAPAVLGRDYIGYGEMQRMLYAENLIKAYHSRARSENWEAWARDNRQAQSELIEAMRLCQTSS
jgi:hypothetical protein